MRATVLILGANGRLGLAAAQAFAEAGWHVLAQARRDLEPAMPAAVRQVRAGLDDIDRLVREAAGASVVVYGVNPLYTRWDQEMVPLARAGMNVAERLGATFMLPGNVYNFGERMPALLHEDTPAAPSTDKGRLRCELEAEMAARAERGSLRSIVVRAGDFYGGGPGSWFDLVIAKSLRAGELVYPGPLDVPHAWAYLPDLARCFVALALAPGLNRFERFHFPGHTLTGQQLLDGIEDRAGHLELAPPRGFRRGRLPWGVIRWLSFAVPMWRELLKMEYLWRVPHALDGTRLARAVGSPVPATPLADAFDASLRAIVVASACKRDGPWLQSSAHSRVRASP